MTDHDPRPEGMPWLSPYLIVSDVENLVDFYQKAFGFDCRDVVRHEERATHAELTYKDALVMVGKQDEENKTCAAPTESDVPSPVFLYLYCNDVDSFYDHAVANGAKGLAKPEDTFWGDRMCRISDPDGYVWCFASKKV